MESDQWFQIPYYFEAIQRAYVKHILFDKSAIAICEEAEETPYIDYVAAAGIDPNAKDRIYLLYSRFKYPDSFEFLLKTFNDMTMLSSSPMLYYLASQQVSSLCFSSFSDVDTSLLNLIKQRITISLHNLNFSSIIPLSWLPPDVVRNMYNQIPVDCFPFIKTRLQESTHPDAPQQLNNLSLVLSKLYIHSILTQLDKNYFAKTKPLDGSALIKTEALQSLDLYYCYGCNQKHSYKHCPTNWNNRCFYCKGEGHMAASCPQKTKQFKDV